MAKRWYRNAPGSGDPQGRVKTRKFVKCPYCQAASLQESRAQLRRWVRRHLVRVHEHTEQQAAESAYALVPVMGTTPA